MIGVYPVSARDGHAVFRLPASPTVTNARGVVHGGAICTLCDASLGTAMRSALQPGDMTATMEIKVNFIAPGQGDLEARAKVVHIGGSSAVGEVEVYGENGTKLVAKALSTFYIKRGAFPPRPGATTAMDPEFDEPDAR